MISEEALEQARDEERDGARYRWLLATWRTMDRATQDKVGLEYRRTSGYGVQDAERLLQAMLGHGICIMGTDPYPPKAFCPTEAGAEEYEEILAAQELMHGE